MNTIEWGANLGPAMAIAFTPIVVTFIAATIYQIYLGVQAGGSGSTKEIMQEKTAAFVNSSAFTALVWTSLVVAAFVSAQNVVGRIPEAPLVNALAAAVLGMVVKTVVEVVGWKHEDMARYSRLTAIQWVLVLATAGAGAAIVA